MNKVSLNVKIFKAKEPEFMEKVNRIFNKREYELTYSVKEEYYKIPICFSIILVYKTDQAKTYEQWMDLIQKLTKTIPIKVTDAEDHICIGRYDSVFEVEQNPENSLFLDATIERDLIMS